MRSHLFSVEILPADIDFMGHVNNARYLSWAQDAVWDHWQLLATARQRAEHLWVAVRHEIEYRRPSFLDDVVTVDLRLDEIKGSRAWYHAFIKRGEDLLAEVRSCWCCVDASTLRPRKIGNDIGARFLARD